jgi:putative NADH-flavin reductase
MRDRPVIAIAGAGGVLGGRITQALLGRGATVRALLRPGSSVDAKRMTGLGAQPAEADPSNVGAMAAALANVDCVVSALNGLQDVIIDRQSVLLDAAVRAGVRRFIPSDFAADFTKTKPGLNRNFDLRREFMARVDAAPI